MNVAVRILVIAYKVQYRHRQERHWLAEVDELQHVRISQDGPRRPDVAFYHADIRAGGEHRPGMRENRRIVIDIGNPSIWRDLLRYLMNIPHRRQASADVKELTDAGIASQE